MNYDFDKHTDRVNTNCIKWDFAADRGMPAGLLPMWVADMDFPAPPEVLEDLRQTLAHGVFGYTDVGQDYYDALIGWFSKRFGFGFTRRDVVKTPGVVYTLAMCVRAFTEPGDAVLIQTPVYYPFYHVVRANGRLLATNPLVYADAAYSVDFADFERKIVTNGVKLFILCSPHNPVGRVWTRAELERMSDICRKHGVIVVSDEIHCDFVFPPHEHTCFGTLDENAVIATAPSKTFNLAALHCANVIVRNNELRDKLTSEINKSGYSQLNVFGLAACQSAYTRGGPWLLALKGYLEGNIRYTRGFLAANLPQVRLVEPQGTYLLWLDFSAYKLPQSALDEKMIHGAGLWLDSGTMFGAEGEGFQRINIACPMATVITALEKLASAFR